MRRWKLPFMVWAAVCSLTASAQNSPQTETIYEMDRNRDKKVIVDEFEDSYMVSSYYDFFDSDRNNVLDQNEFLGALFHKWDKNNDGSLDDREWDRGANNYLVLHRFRYAHNFEIWDRDNDNDISLYEFLWTYDEANIFNGWDADADGLVNRDEYIHGLFRIWDMDGDGFLDDVEYAEWYNDWEM